MDSTPAEAEIALSSSIIMYDPLGCATDAGQPHVRYPVTATMCTVRMHPGKLQSSHLHMHLRSNVLLYGTVCTWSATALWNISIWLSDPTLSSRIEMYRQNLFHIALLYVGFSPSGPGLARGGTKAWGLCDVAGCVVLNVIPRGCA